MVTMKKLLLLSLLSLPAWAQSAIGPSCPATGTPGTDLICTAVLAGGNTTSNGPAGVQWNITTSHATGPITVTIAGTAVAALKDATSNTAINRTIINGINTTLIADGTVAQIKIPLLPTTFCSGNSPCFVVSFNGVAATTLDSHNMAVITSPPASVFVGNKCDVNADGILNVADRTAQDLKALTNPPPASGDLNGDGKVDVVDSQIVINAIRGQGCAAL